jgi:hypothetical protein
MSATASAHDPYAALRIRTYRDYMTGHFLATIGRQAVSVAVSWEIYQWTKSATALGLVGPHPGAALAGVLPAGGFVGRPL